MQWSTWAGENLLGQEQRTSPGRDDAVPQRPFDPVYSDSRAATCQETIGGAPVDGGFRWTRVVVTELKPAFHVRTIHARDCSYVSRPLVGQGARCDRACADPPRS